MELKEFRGQYYVGLSKCSDSSNEVIRNRFNIPLAQLESTLNSHRILCQDIKAQKVTLPKPNTVLKFTNLSKMLYHPFCVYADFESLTKKVSTVLPCPSQSYTSVTERHEAISYTIIVTDVEDNIIFHEYFSGEDVIKQFLNTLKSVSKKLFKKMHETAGMIENVNSTYDPEVCHICKKTFQRNDVRVRDHCHWGRGYIRDYLELYQNVDTIMLAEVFSSFRRTAMQYYELDPLHFLTSSELTWNAGLKFTKVELQLLSDVNDYIWFESEMRGGLVSPR
ncbi:c2H2-type domain-containing protein [Trichonephila clavipes]|nr:c2H2-type domain-containing protein [Trichonephila clavipes]